MRPDAAPPSPPSGEAGQPSGRLLSPDGQFYWNGSGWIPCPERVAAPPKADASQTRKPLLGWLGVIATILALLWSLVLWEQPALFIGVTDLALPMLLACIGVFAATRGSRVGKWIGIIVGGCALLSCLLVLVALLSHDPFSGGMQGS